MGVLHPSFTEERVEQVVDIHASVRQGPSTEATATSTVCHR